MNKKGFPLSIKKKFYFPLAARHPFAMQISSRSTIYNLTWKASSKGWKENVFSRNNESKITTRGSTFKLNSPSTLKSRSRRNTKYEKLCIKGIHLYALNFNTALSINKNGFSSIRKVTRTTQFNQYNTTSSKKGSRVRYENRKRGNSVLEKKTIRIVLPYSTSNL